MTIEMAQGVLLALAPHADDCELGAGASIAKWCQAGDAVHCVAFSACETIQRKESRDVLRNECAGATSVLGVKSENLEILDFEVRHFDRERQRVPDVMVELNRRLSLDLVLIPSSDDTRQDHFVVSDEARRAFMRTRMLGYEAPWNNFRFETSVFVTVDEGQISLKVEALSRFNSQAARPYMNCTFQEWQLRFRGVQAGVEYAEAFQVMRWYL